MTTRNISYFFESNIEYFETNVQQFAGFILQEKDSRKSIKVSNRWLEK